MTDNNKHLVRIGHEFAAAMSDDTPIITIAKMVTELASALDVQSARSDALAAKLHNVCAENAALREYRPKPSGAAMMEALDAFYEYHEDVPEQGMMAAFEILCCKRPEIPNTDAWVNEQRAVGVEMFVSDFTEPAVMSDGKFYSEDLIEASKEFAAQLRGSQV